MGERIPNYNYYIEIPSQPIVLIEYWMKEQYPDERFALLGKTNLKKPWNIPRKWRLGFETKEAMIACKLKFG